MAYVDAALERALQDKARVSQAYQIARKIEDLVVDANTLDERREIDIAIEHLETAAMWLNKAHYAAKKEK